MFLKNNANASIRRLLKRFFIVNLYGISIGFFFAFMLFGCTGTSDRIEERREDGTLIKLYYLNKDSLMEGNYTSYFEDGVRIYEQSNYINGELDGNRRIFNELGQLEIEEMYVHGILNDTLRIFYESGAIKVKMPYKSGILEGLATKYYANGAIQEEVWFENNQENGPFREYHENGNLRWEGKYLNGENEFGELRNYNEQGELIKIMLCDSAAICRTTWTKNY